MSSQFSPDVYDTHTSSLDASLAAFGRKEIEIAEVKLLSISWLRSLRLTFSRTVRARCLVLCTSGRRYIFVERPHSQSADDFFFFHDSMLLLSP